MKKQAWFRWGSLVVLIIGFVLIYLTYQTYGNWSFALALRGKKLLAFALVAIAAAFSTISFQTLTQNHFLTPNILGLDALYIVIQTGFFFVQGQTLLTEKTSLWFFLGNLGLMMGFSLVFIQFLLKKAGENLFLLVMIGMIISTFFHNISTFLQVIMNPNEYDVLQGRILPSFGNMKTQHLLIAGVLLVLFSAYIWRQRHILDVFHLGQDQATNLGVDVFATQKGLLLAISGLVGIATALVGPVTFLGFLVANLSYQWAKTFQHQERFLIGSLLGFLLLVSGQFLVEQLFQWHTPLSVVVEFSGGVYFIGKIVKERKQNG